MSEQVAVEEGQVIEQTLEQAAQDESAAVSAGYNKARGEPAKVDETKTDATESVVTEDKQEDPPAQAAAPAADPWEGVPPVLRETLDKLSATVNHIGPALRRLKSAEDRIEAIGNASKEAAKAATSAGAQAPTQAQVASASASGEKWKQIKDDFPEWADAMDERLAALGTAQAPQVDVDGLRRELAEGTRAQVAGAIDTAEERAYVRFKHPAWRKTVTTPEYVDWFKSQPPEFRALEQSDLADDAIKVLDAYAEHQKTVAAKAATEAKNKSRLTAVVAPKQASSGGPTVLPDEAGLSVGYSRVRRA